MSEGDVSLIRDEDLLRRMWQQTEDFSRKKEIRAHMYRLREERLRNLHSPEPTPLAKGVSPAMHVASFVDQSFQGLKSKEVRDAGSPPKEFRADLKELSNAGWNIESENKISDDGHTKIHGVHATVEGRFDVAGGCGQFAAVDSNRQAETEYHDDNSSMRRREAATNTAAREQVFRQTDDGTHFSSSTNSSSATSKFEQISSNTYEVPYKSDDCDQSRRETSSRNESSQVTKTNEYENLRKSAEEHGELISRKVDYPDNNTKIIVETRSLPDGTTVTSTRKEFRAPTQSAQSEQYSRNENRSYTSSTHRSTDKKESSNFTQAYNNNDIVESQRKSDDYDFKRNHIEHTKNEFTNTQKVIKKAESTKYDTKESSSKTTRETIDGHNVNIEKINESKIRTLEKNDHVTSDDYSQSKISNKYSETNRNDTNQCQITTNKDFKNNENYNADDNITHKTYKENITSDDKSVKIDGSDVQKTDDRQFTRRHKIDEINEKKTTNEYETTYQSDYSQKKISNDWSPSHQAWASTLRADSPSKAHSARASSPGSRTYQSSTSSLRSSISPDKTYRKPTSREQSPSKLDRTSPTRRTTERVSTTDASRVDKTYRHTRSDMKPPTSPSRYNKSPDRKPDGYRQRPSQSPEKHLAGNKTHTSPERNSDTPRNLSPSRHTDRTSPSDDFKRTPNHSSPRHSQSVSPDRKPGYMKPTIASKIPDNPTKSSRFSQSPERQHSNKTRYSEDHYKFVDEETKMYTRTTDTTDFARPESPSLRSSIRKESRSPSPPKGAVTFIDDKTKTEIATDVCTKYENINVSNDNQHREPSPSKYDTYDKKRRNEETTSTTENNYDSVTSQHQTSIKSNLRTSPSPTKKIPRDSVSPVKSSDSPRNPSPTKYGTYDKKYRCEETEDITYDKEIDEYNSQRMHQVSTKKSGTPSSPTKNIPRENVSPLKSPNKDSEYKYTANFINTEKTTEDSNKASKHSRPRQLITPSTSPTRKPKNNDTEPSTGQSSPTTSVSGFVYFSSPKVNKTIVTDLDDESFELETTRTDQVTTVSHKRPESLKVERSPSPSKIPCRSPSPEKQVSPTKENLPRKSSLKKPSSGNNLQSPVEKPPSSFRVSPTVESHDFPEHKIVKKDRPDKEPLKTKYPLERRETYEERCLKILGVVDNSTEDNEINNTTTSQTSKTKEESLLTTKATMKETTNIETSNFIRREQEGIDSKYTISQGRKAKAPSRNTSPTKLQDIISPHKTSDSTEDVDNQKFKSGHRSVSSEKSKLENPKESSKTGVNRISDQKEHSPSRSSVSPDCKTYTKSTKVENTDETRTTRISSDRETGYQNRKEKVLINSRSSSPTKDKVRANTSPGRKLASSPYESADEKLRDKTPTRSFTSPDKNPGYMKPTASSISRYDETVSVDTREENSTLTSEEKTIQHSEIRSDSPRHSRSPSLNRHVTKDVTTTKDKVGACTSPDRKLASSPDESSDNKIRDKTPTRSFTSPDKNPGYMNPTASSISRYDETVSMDTREENSTLTSEEKTIQHSEIRSDSPRHSRSPSLNRHVTKDVTQFIQSEREQEILDKVHRSLRKLSPNRSQRSPSREKSPGKSAISLEDIEVRCNNSEDSTFIKESTTSKSNEISTQTRKIQTDKKDQKLVSKLATRTVSPTKKPTTSTPVKKDRSPTSKSPESPNISRSISPKKPASPTGRSQSPQVSKPSGIKPREPTPVSFTRKPSSGNMSPTKTEKVTTEQKKVTKQNSFTSVTKSTTSKNTVSNKTESDLKRTPTPKGINKENVSPKKEDVKVTRTTSDLSLRTKKVSPQRNKSKPEIQVTDASSKNSKNSVNITSTTKKSLPKETQSKLAPKPKSATALNTSIDDDDIIIDVEQAKSSRENSPDRICPTPINFLDDVSTPRYPDEVNEPDDEFRKRSHHTIHETESIVDDIVEICEDDELFVKCSNISESDECLLSVTDKVSKFTDKIENVTKPKDKESSSQFKDVERLVHSDFIDEKLKSDECLLSVTEKVNKFAKGPKVTKDRSPVRKITDEFDTQTTYQDDYTKLSVNDKAHLFVETAENAKSPKIKPNQKTERPDLSNIDESLKSDDCLLSVSAKVNKFVKTAEQFLSESTETKEKEHKVREKYEKFMKHITKEEEDTPEDKQMKTTNQTELNGTENKKISEDKVPSFARETEASHLKVKDFPSSNLKSAERIPPVKITTLRSSEAVKKAKALFENIASTQKSSDVKITKLTDIGIKKSPKTDSTIVLHPSAEVSPNGTDIDSEVDAPHGVCVVNEHPLNGSIKQQHPQRPIHEKLRSSPNRLLSQSPEIPRGKSPMHRSTETTVSKTVLSRYPIGKSEPKPIRSDVLKQEQSEEKSKVTSFQRPTKTSHVNEKKSIEETEVSSRRGSGKFGVELRRTSVEKTTFVSERRRSSSEHPCIEDIFDLDLLEQMLEKVVGYEQRRRIRAQIRVARKRMESEKIDTNTYTRTKSIGTPKTRSPDRKTLTKSPERRKPSQQKTLSPERLLKTTQTRVASSEQSHYTESSQPLMNGHAKEPNIVPDKRNRLKSPEKIKSLPKTRSPIRQPSPDKKTRRVSPSKIATKPKTNRFSEYASAYMKKVGLSETDKLNFAEKAKKADIMEHSKSETESENHVSSNYIEEHRAVETKTMSTSKIYSERTSSKDRIEIVQMNGKRSQSPEKKGPGQRSPTERLYQRSPSPDFKRTRSDNKETIKKTVSETQAPKIDKTEPIVKPVYEEPIVAKTVYDTQKKVQEEKPSWVTNRNLKKIGSETRTFSSKKVEPEKPRYRGSSPSKALARTTHTPTDVITSSYGPGPLDADGRPLFGIKALRNGASNCQVKGTVIRSEYHSRNGGEPEGSVSVTAYSTQPEDLERLLRSQGERPSRIHGLAAITTTKKFGGDSGTTLREAHTKEDRAALEQFTHSDRKVAAAPAHVQSPPQSQSTRRTANEMREEVRKEEREKREERKTVRQSSVKSLTEKYIKSASETSRNERSSAYPKAGLILRTANMKDSISSDSSAHAGLGRTDSEHSLGSVEDHHTTTTTSTSTTTRSHQQSQSQSHRSSGGVNDLVTSPAHAHRTERSFLDSTTKVTGVQDILTRMKNADIVINEGDSSEDAEARALLNKFLGATVLMAGMQSYVTEKPHGKIHVTQEKTVRSSTGSGGGTKTTTTTTKRVEDIDLDQCWDEQVLRRLLEESTDYEQRRRLRARIRTLMAEQEACASAVTAALGAADGGDAAEAEAADVDAREEEEVTVTSSVRRNSSEKTVSSSTTTKTSKVIESISRGAPKPVSPFAKFRQLEKQNSINSPNSPKSPQSPGSPAKAPYFKFTDPALHASALTIKERLLQWCRDKTRDYENVKLENFSTSWADGLAFCALVHHFLPDAFDYSKLTPDKRRHNFTLAFKVADEKAGIYPLLDVDDMVAMRKPDWKCVFTYVQAIHRRFKDEP